MVSKGIQKYLDGAMQVLDRFGLAQTEPEESQLAGILQDAVHVDEAKVTAIARVVQYQGTFNSLVRDNIEAMDVSTDYDGITDRFNSIRDDSKRLVEQLEDGDIDFREKMSNFWMKLTRGTTHDRFEEIKKIYDSVSDRTKDQLEREDAIMDGYMDFRFALKQAEILSREVLQVQEGRLEESRKKFDEATTLASNYDGENDAELSRLQFDRDEKQRAFQDEDRTYQLVKDVADNLTVGYNVGETLVAKLKQTHDLKERVYRQAVTFFTTNEHVFTTMDAIYTAQHGLHEQTQTLDAMKEGANKGLEDIAEMGHALEKAALRAGYGPTINADSVQKLVNAVVDFQKDSYAIANQLREEATQNAKDISRIVDEGKQRVSEALQGYASAAQ